MRTTKRLTVPSIVAAAAAAAAVLSGCGLSNPAATPTTGAPAAHGPTKSTTPSAPKADSSVPAIVSKRSENEIARGAGAATQRAAINQYMQLWCNWTNSTLVAHEVKLASISLGSARAQEQIAASAPHQGPNRQTITTTCQQLSLSPGVGPADGQWVLVTSSQTKASGDSTMAPQFHVTYVHLAKRGHTYLIDQWQPQS